MIVHLPFSEDVTALAKLKSVTIRVDVVPVVVDGMEESVALNLGRATRGVVNVVALKGNQIVGSSEVESPVMATIASGGPAGSTINVAVGDGDSARGAGTENDVLSSDALSGNVVDPTSI